MWGSVWAPLFWTIGCIPTKSGKWHNSIRFNPFWVCVILYGCTVQYVMWIYVSALLTFWNAKPYRKRTGTAAVFTQVLVLGCHIGVHIWCMHWSPMKAEARTFVSVAQLWFSSMSAFVEQAWKIWWFFIDSNLCVSHCQRSSLQCWKFAAGILAHTLIVTLASENQMPATEECHGWALNCSCLKSIHEAPQWCPAMCSNKPSSFSVRTGFPALPVLLKRVVRLTVWLCDEGRAKRLRSPPC